MIAARPLAGILLLARIAEVCRTWTWKHWGLAALLGAVPMLSGPTGGYLLSARSTDWYAAYAWRAFLMAFTCLGLPLTVATRVADVYVDNGARPIGAYGVAVFVVAAAGSGLSWLLLTPWLAPAASVSPMTSFVWSTLAYGLQMALGLAIYAHWRETRHSMARVRALETERAHQARLVHESRLMALRARVEPRTLFDALRRLSELVPADPESADLLLADLIALLRAILPSATASASTVGREFTLVRAYARVSNAPDLQPPRLHLTASLEVGEARIAPMLVLPLLRALPRMTPAGPVNWAVDAQRHADVLRIELTGTCESPRALWLAVAAADLAMIRERLASVHGPAAELRIVHDPAPKLILDLPHHHDDSADR